MINEYLYYYNRLNENSISSNISLNYLENYIFVINHIDTLLKDLGFNSQARNQIINQRVRDIVYCINRSESYQYLISGKIRQRIQNIKQLINHPFISNYTNYFPIDNSLTKIMNHLINKKRYFLIFIVNLLLISLQKIRDRVLRRV